MYFDTLRKLAARPKNHAVVQALESILLRVYGEDELRKVGPVVLAGYGIESERHLRRSALHRVNEALDLPKDELKALVEQLIAESKARQEELERLVWQ